MSASKLAAYGLALVLSHFTPAVTAANTAAPAPKPAAPIVTGNIGPRGEDLLTLDNGTVKVGIDRAKGAAIT